MRALALVPCSLVILLTPAAAQSRPDGPPPGRMVEIGGHRLHLLCVGPDTGRTVILEAGGGAYSTTWKAVQDSLATRAHTCAYDRAGSGWSEPGPRPNTMHQQVFELHALLQAAGLRGPFVLVGHSIGAMVVRMYTAQYGDDVAGVVLVDPTHENATLFNLPRNRWVRMREEATDRPVPEPRAGGTSTDSSDYTFEEFKQIYLDRAANPVSLGDRPLIVLGAGRRPAPPGTSEDLWRTLRRERDDQITDLGGLSTNSKVVVDPASTHAIQADNPAIVARSIAEVLDALARGSRVSP